MGWAEISHPFHPLRGRRFEVLKKRRVAGVDTLVVSSAIRPTNPELVAARAAVVLVLGIVDVCREVARGAVEREVVNLLNRILRVLILVEIMHTVVLSLRAHHLVTQPLLAVGLVAVIRKILFVLSSEGPISTAELALLIAMIAVFVAALILASRFDRIDS